MNTSTARSRGTGRAGAAAGSDEAGSLSAQLAARAFDVARYLLWLGIPTGVGQVTSIRTLERQVRRMKASEYQEVRELAGEIAEACAAEPACRWDSNASAEAVAPTLARHVDVDQHLARSRDDLRRVGRSKPARL